MTAEERGQTAIDYAVGIGVFLLTVAFVFAFLPSMFAPFTTESGDLLVLADRSADLLSSDLLVESVTAPATLNATCTVDFFDSGGPEPPGCRYAEDTSDLRDALSVERAGAQINVTIYELGDGPRTLDGTTLAAGESPPSNANVAVASRSVLLDGRQSRLVVRVW